MKKYYRITYYNKIFKDWLYYDCTLYPTEALAFRSIQRYADGKSDTGLKVVEEEMPSKKRNTKAKVSKI